MRSGRPIGGFFARLLLLYILLVIPWPGLKPTYARCYSSVATLVFGSLVPGGAVRFTPMPEPMKGYDVRMDLVNLRTSATQTAMVSSRDPAYFQTAFLVSLILATPLPWRRRLKSLVVGIVAVHAFMFLRVLLTILHGFARGRVGLLSPDPPWDTILSVLARVALADIVSLLMVPVLIWILITFRQADWERWAHADGNPLRLDVKVE